MLLRGWWLAVALAACAAGAGADDNLAPLAPLLGCWRGVLEGAPSLHDDRCFERHGGAIRDMHYVRPTEYSGETIYRYDAQRGLTFRYVSSNGGASSGALVVGDGALEFPDHAFVDAGGAVRRLRSVWRFEGPDRFVATSETWEEGAWRPFGTIVYTRVAE